MTFKVRPLNEMIPIIMDAIKHDYDLPIHKELPATESPMILKIKEQHNRIEAQDKRNKELEAALRNCCDKWENGNGICEWLEAVDEARAALGEKKDGH
jgi:hypothetical protein